MSNEDQPEHGHAGPLHQIQKDFGSFHPLPPSSWRNSSSLAFARSPGERPADREQEGEPSPVDSLNTTGVERFKCVGF